VSLPDCLRGEVWLTRLDPTEGNELRKTRPCVIISPDAMNAGLGTVIVMPLTSGSHAAGFRAPTVFRGIPGFLLGDQLRAVSKGRLIRRVGVIDGKTMGDALAILREMFMD
jgi:mRNA interferase MazF